MNFITQVSNHNIIILLTSIIIIPLCIIILYPFGASLWSKPIQFLRLVILLKLPIPYIIPFIQLIIQTKLNNFMLLCTNSIFLHKHIQKSIKTLSASKLVKKKYTLIYKYLQIMNHILLHYPTINVINPVHTVKEHHLLMLHYTCSLKIYMRVKNKNFSELIIYPNQKHTIQKIVPKKNISIFYIYKKHLYRFTADLAVYNANDTIYKLQKPRHFKLNERRKYIRHYEHITQTITTIKPYLTKKNIHKFNLPAITELQSSTVISYDISMKGCCLASTYDLPRNTILELIIHLPNQSNIYTKARVINTTLYNAELQNYYYKIHVMFYGMHIQNKIMLGSYILKL